MPDIRWSHGRIALTVGGMKLTLDNPRTVAAPFGDRFAHVARWDPAEEWIEMWLRTDTAQTVRVDGLDLTVEFAAGEAMRTEISAKFTQARVEAELAAAGLALEAWWTDPAGDFALSLSRLA